MNSVLHPLPGLFLLMPHCLQVCMVLNTNVNLYFLDYRYFQRIVKLLQRSFKITVSGPQRLSQIMAGLIVRLMFIRDLKFITAREQSAYSKSMPFRPLLVAFSYLTNIYSKSLMSVRSADLINKEAINIVHTFREEPFFLFLNYMETHTPYLPPRPFDNYFLHKTFTQPYRLKQYYLRVTGAEDKHSWDSFLQSQYDGAIAYLDCQLGKLFSHLKEIGVYDSSLIIVTADHGDLLGEHGGYEHHGHMYEGVVKVPLIIKFPFSKRVGRETRLINLADLLPTILSICDLSYPPKYFGAGIWWSFICCCRTV